MSVSRRQFLVGSVMSALATQLKAAGTSINSKKLPNILWFISEDNFPVIGAYGDKLARTPTIDKLAKNGVLFKHAYCASPVCGPSRFSLATGVYPQASGLAENFGSTDEVLRHDMRGCPSYLRDMGYYCTNNAKKNYNSQMDFVEMWDESSRQAHWRNGPDNKPFYSVFTTFTTHESCLFTPLSGNVGPQDVTVPPYLPDTPGVRQDFATYYNAMEKMDGELAEKLQELEETGRADDTIIFYFSDNGGITPRGKRYCYELGLRCPLVVYIPPKWAHLSKHLPGTEVAEPVSFVDFVPSVLSLADIAKPAHMQGRALLGKHAGNSAPDYIFGGRLRMDERYDFIRTVTDTRFRYIRNYAPHRPWGQHVSFMMQARSYQDWYAMHLEGTLNEVQDRFWHAKPFEELYDVQTDPHQVVNLVTDQAYSDKLAELRTALDKHIIDYNDNGFIPEGVPLQGYLASRKDNAYDITRIKTLADKAAARTVEAIPEFVRALDDNDEVIRYWGAQGLLILGEQAKPVAEQMKVALGKEQSVAVRIALAEGLVNLINDRQALRVLGTILDQEDDGPFRLQAINALTYVGEKALPVLPAIKRSVGEDHRHVRSAAAFLLQKLEGIYDPHKPIAKMGGHVFLDPEVELNLDFRFYD